MELEGSTSSDSARRTPTAPPAPAAWGVITSGWLPWAALSGVGVLGGGGLARSYGS